VVGHADVDRLIVSLGSEFSAALTCEEDLAAADLAFSLSQDISISEDLTRMGGVLLMPDAEAPIDHLGHDFVLADRWLVPTGKAVVRLGGPRPVSKLPDVLVAVLRRLARTRAEVVAGAAGRGHRGLLARATPEYVLVQGIGSVALPMGSIDYVRLVREGSADRADDECAGRGDLGCCEGSTDSDRVRSAWKRLRERRLLNR
jgi:hypothetical protein